MKMEMVEYTRDNALDTDAQSVVSQDIITDHAKVKLLIQMHRRGR